MATAKLLSENERIELKEMNQSVRLALPNAERQDDDRKIYECVFENGATNIDYLTNVINIGNSDVNYIAEHGRTALHEAVRKGEVETVNLLMSAGASLEFKDVDGNTALHYACLQTTWHNYKDIFKILFPPKKNIESIRISQTRERSKIQKCRYHTRTFEQTWFDAATSTNENGDNILDLLLKEDRLIESKREIVQYLVKETEMFYLLKLLRNTPRIQNSTSEVGRPFESNDNNSINTPLRRLLQLYPEVISELLDRCIVKCTGKVNYHFELLDDTYLLHTWPPQQEYYCKWLYQSKWEHIDAEEIESREAYTKHLSQIRNNHPVMLMLKYKRDTSKDPGKKEVYRQLVDHPLVKALIRHKWHHIGKKLHVMSLSLYLVFLCTLTTFVIAIDTLYERFQDSGTKSTASNKTGNYSKDCNSTTLCNNKSESYNVTTTPTANDRVTCETYGNYPMITVLQIVVIFQAIILLLKEIHHIVMTFGLEYFKHFKNYIKWTAYTTALFFLIDLSECPNTGYRETWQWTLGTVAIFLSWVDLLAYLEKFDWLGIYVSMLKRITITFLRNIFPIVAILLVAFALAFLCARKKQDEFKNILVSLLSTSAMMAEGFGYEDLSEEHIVYLAFISHLVSSIFLIIMTIITMNLMVGVAVSDVKEVYMRAIESQFTLQIEDILELERICQTILTILIRFRCTKKIGIWLKVKFIQQPNREVLTGRLKSEEIPKHIRDKDQSENLGQKLDELISLKEDMCNLMRLMKEEHERLREIAVR
ncbi:transient receptor potential cation channel subfamily A member 1 homolog [Ruditapes philippinarum]|uniref:transient receptor potential cation channel subfamily A member 1 homolog n=1 Tax=Ruditapes philippinarum TaxID=129788 RepID=UPI00295C0252|nr:transient receptor potential cation channel subfamily A member 1 homolog [Ruditapes philippinarum]